MRWALGRTPAGMSTRKPAGNSHAVSTREEVRANLEASFAEVVSFIEQARQRVYQAVNTELVGLYWQIGEYIRQQAGRGRMGRRGR
jgi:hypothetical protein